MQKRKVERVSVALEVKINRTVLAEGLDLSETGMYIYTKANFIPGSIIDLRFALDGEAVHVSAIVQHVQPGIGMGVKFVHLPPSEAEKIKHFVTRQTVRK